MSPQVISLTDIALDADAKDIGLYQFGSKVARHYFCKTCGIYTHNEMLSKPGHVRVNIGCIDGLDSSQFEVTVFDGKTLL